MVQTECYSKIRTRGPHSFELGATLTLSIQRTLSLINPTQNISIVRGNTRTVSKRRGLRGQSRGQVSQVSKCSSHVNTHEKSDILQFNGGWRCERCRLKVNTTEAEKTRVKRNSESDNGLLLVLKKLQSILRLATYLISGDALFFSIFLPVHSLGLW